MLNAFECERAEVPEGVKMVGAEDFLRGVAGLHGGVGDYMMLHSGAGNGASVIGWGELRKICLMDRGAMLGRGPLVDLEREICSCSFRVPHGLVGWLGFVSYDVGRTLERVPARATDDLGWPVAWFGLFRNYAVFLPGGGLECYAMKWHRSEAERVDWEGILRGARASCAGGGAAKLLSAQTRGAFEAKVERVKRYIAEGDVYQVNLAQRWEFGCEEAPEEVFARLCGISPAPYAACMRFEHEGVVRHAVSASPELFLAADGERHAMTRPIKGTRPRDLGNAGRDEALRDELMGSAKDHAELTMIVDLLRNDLGRVAEFGSVRVAEARGLEKHPTVWHTAATIEARLRRDAGLAEILGALCPGGSITGAPKIRAMQIIEELEPVRRGLYCGNIGVIGPLGETMGLNVAIRTMMFQKGRAYVHAGGGIVADSDAGKEYEETLHKAAAMFRALGVE